MSLLGYLLFFGIHYKNAYVDGIQDAVWDDVKGIQKLKAKAEQRKTAEEEMAKGKGRMKTGGFFFFFWHRNDIYTYLSLSLSY